MIKKFNDFHKINEDLTTEITNDKGYTMFWYPQGGLWVSRIENVNNPTDAYKKFMKKWMKKYRNTSYAEFETIFTGNTYGLKYVREDGLNGQVYYFNELLSDDEIYKTVKSINKNYGYKSVDYTYIK